MNLSDLTLEQLVEQRLQFEEQMETAEAGKSLVSEELMKRLDDMKINGTKTSNGYLVQKVTKRLYAQVEITWAESQGATKTVKKVDESLVKKLAEAGVGIPNLKIISYIQIKEAK